MNLFQLRYFVTLAKMQHYTRAAHELCITQPSLSHAISQLEAELGVALFEKSGRNTTLTSFGEEFLICANRTLATLDSGVSSLQRSARGDGLIRLEVPPAVAVGNSVLLGPGHRLGIPRLGGHVPKGDGGRGGRRTLHPPQHGHYRGPGYVGGRGKLALAHAGHIALFGHLIDCRLIPRPAGHICIPARGCRGQGQAGTQTHGTGQRRPSLFQGIHSQSC